MFVFYSVFKVWTAYSRYTPLLTFCTSSALRNPFLDAHHMQSMFYKIMSGSRLLSHAVSSIVPSAARIFTVVFGMGTGVASARIATRQNFQRISNLSENRRAAPLSELPHRCRHSHPAALARRYMLMSVRSSRPRICSCGHGIHSAFPRCFPHMRTRQKRNPYSLP